MPADKKASKGDSKRIPRVEKEIREVVGLYLLHSMRKELKGMVSVSRVIAGGDLRTAKILIVMMGLEESPKTFKKETLALLNERAGEIQNQLNRKLQMRHVPRLTFHYDDGFDNALKVETILRDIGLSKKSTDAPKKAEEASDDAAEDDE